MTEVLDSSSGPSLGMRRHGSAASPEVSSGRRAYYDRVRRDVLAHVPASCTRILSTGCGSGATESELLDRGAFVVGIELDPLVAEQARRRGLTVICGDASA